MLKFPGAKIESISVDFRGRGLGGSGSTTLVSRGPPYWRNPPAKFCQREKVGVIFLPYFLVRMPLSAFSHDFFKVHKCVGGWNSLAPKAYSAPQTLQPTLGERNRSGNGGRKEEGWDK